MNWSFPYFFIIMNLLCSFSITALLIIIMIISMVLCGKHKGYKLVIFLLQINSKKCI